MNKKSQKFAAIAIGFVLSVLLIYIGFRIVQKRGSQAGIAEHFECTKENEDETKAKCIWDSRDSEKGKVLYASTPQGGIQNCNLVFIAEELDEPVALGDGNFSHTVFLQPLVPKQSYCAAPGGDEDKIVEVTAPTRGSGQTATDGNPVLLDTTPTPAALVVDPSPTSTTPTSTPVPQPSMGSTTDAEIDTYYNDPSNTGDDWGDCLDYFEKKGQQVSGNACIKGYYRHNTTPTPASS